MEANGMGVRSRTLNEESEEREARQEREARVLRDGYISLADWGGEREITVKVMVRDPESGKQVPAYISVAYDPESITDDMRARFLGDQANSDDNLEDAALAFPRAIARVVTRWGIEGPLHRVIERRWKEVVPEGCDPDTDDFCEEFERSERRRVLLVPPGEIVPHDDPNVVRHLPSALTQSIMQDVFQDVQGAIPERQRPSRKRR